MVRSPEWDAAHRLGVELRKLRRARGLAQRDLCKALNLASHTTIVEFESGRRVPSLDTLAAYERCFGLAPGTLRPLRGDALAQRAAMEAREAITPGPGTPDRRGGRASVVPRLLPPSATGFTGRGAELSALDRHLDTEAPAPVLLSAISGMGGIGKTTLAVHWGHLARHRFPDGDLYVDLCGYHPSRQPVPASEALGALLSALGVPAGQLPVSMDGRAAEFRTLMTGRRMLLVLDNARTADQVRPLLPASPACVVLITSRSRLGGLVARDGVCRIEVDALAPPEARRLLRQVIGAQRADAEPGAVAALAELCGYHPLALRIAAERVTASRHGSIAAALAQLSGQFCRLDALATGDDETTAIRAVFTWSYDALDPACQYLFRLLGLHGGTDITVPAAAALAELPVERCAGLMADLVGAHLVAERGLGRFRMHDLLALFARDRALAEEPEAGQRHALARLGSWYLHSACAARVALNPHLPPMHPPPPATSVPPQALASHAEALSWYEAERVNLVSMSVAAARNHDDPVAWQLPTALYAYFDLRKHYADWITTHRGAIEAARRLGDAEAEGKVLCNLGNAYRPLGQLEDATECYVQALALFRRAGYTQGEAKVLGNLASTHHEADRLTEAVTTDEAAIAAFSKLGDRHGEALCLANLGRVYVSSGCYAEAARCEGRAIELFAGVGDRHGRARATSNLGVIECRLGHLEPASRLLTQAHSDFAALGDRHEEAGTLVDLAELSSARGEAAEAKAHLERALAIFDEIGDRRRHAEVTALLRANSEPAG